MYRLFLAAVLASTLTFGIGELRAEVAPLWSTVKLVDGAALPVLQSWKWMSMPGRASLVAVQITRRDLEGGLSQQTFPFRNLVRGDAVAEITRVYAGDERLISRQAVIRVIRGGRKAAAPPFQSDSIPSEDGRGVWLVVKHRGDLRGIRCMVANASFPVYDKAEVPALHDFGVWELDEIEEFANRIEVVKKEGLPTADHILSLASADNRCIAQWAAGLATSGAVELTEEQLMAICKSREANALAQSQIDDCLISTPSTAKSWRTHEVRKEMYRRWLQLSEASFRDIYIGYLQACFKDWDDRGFGDEALDHLVSDALGHHQRTSIEWKSLHQMFPKVRPPSTTITLPAE
ncbi:hypothetical protein [Posidoniimonas corsicana]|nr:hypothetical protein [Posidoniimonas corsicana]